ncbi:hypothetical protein ACQJBY_034163 [Aegilops geniculata]
MDKAPAAAAANKVGNPPAAAAANNVARPPAAVLQVVVIAPAANVVVNPPANVVVNPPAEAASARGAAAASAANANAWKKKKDNKCCMIFPVVGQIFLALLLVAHAAYNVVNSPAPGAADVALLALWLIYLAMSVVTLVLLLVL